MLIIKFSLDIISLFSFMAFPLINLLISLLDFSSFDKIIKSKTVIFSLIFFALIFIVGKLEPSKFPVVGFDAVEPWCRRRGLGVIHGGHNALRFTPHFRITSEEIDLIIDIVRDALIAFS